MTNETIAYGTCACGVAAQLFRTGKCAHCYIADLERRDVQSHTVLEEKPVAWLIVRPDTVGKGERREVVLNPLTDSTFMDEGDSAWPLYRRFNKDESPDTQGEG